MLKRTLLFAALAFSLPANAQEAEQLVPPDIGVRVAEGYATPRTAAFHRATEHLEGTLQALCESPGAEALARARDAFGDTVRTWGPVSILRFGPLVSENRFEHLFFWPDPRGITLRQVQGLLAEKEENATTADGLKAKSVALQGLPALEYVLFGSGSEALAEGGAGFRCDYAAAIAANAAARAGALAEAWAPGADFHEQFTEPQAEHALYRTPEEVAGEIINALGTGLQFVRNAELLPPLGESVERANGKRAPLWRSDLTFVLVEAQIGGMKDLVETANFKSRIGPPRGAMVDSVLFDLIHALEAIQAVEASAGTAFADPQDRGRITYAGVALEGANHTIGEQLAAAIGLRMGFNALDGD